MDHINELINNRQSTTTQQTGETTYSAEEATQAEKDAEQAKKIMNDLFSRLQAACPAWKQAYSNQAAYEATKAEWLKSFLVNGLNDVPLINDAVELLKLSGKDFFPTVGSFIGFYKKAALTRSGAPETAKAYRMLRGYLQVHSEQRDPSRLHPYIYHTLISPAFDPMNFNRMDGEKALKHFSTQYMLTVDYALQGGVIKQCAPKERQIESKPHNPSGIVVKSHREVGKLAIQSLKESLR